MANELNLLLLLQRPWDQFHAQLQLSVTPGSEDLIPPASIAQMYMQGKHKYTFFKKNYGVLNVYVHPKNFSINTK